MTWSVYLLRNEITGLTYIGSALDPHRRLRQHSGEISGGARATKHFQGHWQLICWLEGYPNRGAALYDEMWLKRNYRGFKRRYHEFLVRPSETTWIVRLYYQDNSVNNIVTLR